MQVTERLWITDCAAGTATKAFAVTYDDADAGTAAARARCLADLTGARGLQVTRLPARPGPAVGAVAVSWAAVRDLAPAGR